MNLLHKKTDASIDWAIEASGKSILDIARGQRENHSRIRAYVIRQAPGFGTVQM